MMKTSVMQNLTVSELLEKLAGFWAQQAEAGKGEERGEKPEAKDKKEGLAERLGKKRKAERGEKEEGGEKSEKGDAERKAKPSEGDRFQALKDRLRGKGRFQSMATKGHSKAAAEKKKLSLKVPGAITGALTAELLALHVLKNHPISAVPAAAGSLLAGMAGAGLGGAAGKALD